MPLSDYLCSQQTGPLTDLSRNMLAGTGQILASTYVKHAYFLKLNIWNEFYFSILSNLKNTSVYENVPN